MHRKIIIAIGILIIFIAVGIIIAIQLFWEKDKLLIDYLPAEADFWFWQKSGGFSDKSAVALRQLGADANIITALQNHTGEIAVYYLKGRWFKLEYLGRRTALRKEGADVVGFLNQNYVGERFTGFEFIFKPRAYYFALKRTDDALYFSFTDQEKIKFKQLTVFEPKKYSLGFLNNNAFILAVRLQDQTLLNSIVGALKKNIADFTAFDFPVVISKTLPDQTVITEKAAKPELFVWQESAPYAYQLRLNQQEAEKFKLGEQLAVFSSNYNYYQDNQTAIFALNGDWSKTAAFNSIDSADFFYLNLSADADLAEILGRSKILSWLQDLGVDSVMFYDSGSMVEGQLIFESE